MAGRGFFVTGTDTGCGKTEITLGLMHALQQRGDKVLGMKPVASGAVRGPEGLRNEDAVRIQARCSIPIDYAQVNPYAFKPPIAPHLAARQSGEDLRFSPILETARQLRDRADWLLVEGVGGWRVPLGPDGDVADLAAALDLPVILVVGLRLGCINHALLSVESIRARGVGLAAWVANRVDPNMLEVDANIDTLVRLIDAPCLGVAPWTNDIGPATVAGVLNIQRVIE